MTRTQSRWRTAFAVVATIVITVIALTVASGIYLTLVFGGH